MHHDLATSRNENPSLEIALFTLLVFALVAFVYNFRSPEKRSSAMTMAIYSYVRKGFEVIFEIGAGGGIFELSVASEILRELH